MAAARFGAHPTTGTVSRSKSEALVEAQALVDNHQRREALVLLLQCAEATQKQCSKVQGFASTKQAKKRSKRINADPEALDLDPIQDNAYLQLMENLCCQLEDWTTLIRVLAPRARTSLPPGPTQQKAIALLLNQGIHLYQANQMEKLAVLYCQILAAQPNHPAALMNLGVCLRRLNDYQSAEQFLRRHLEIEPNSHLGWNAYGNVLTDLGRNQDAMLAFQKSIEINPSYCDAHSNLADQFHRRSDCDRAYLHSKRAIELNPERLENLVDHLTRLRRVCAFDELEARNWFDVVDSLPERYGAFALLQLLTLTDNAENQARLLSFQQRWGAAMAHEAAQQPLTPLSRCVREHGPLRIGFVSADFKDHSVARFILPLFEGLDRSKFSLYGYSTFFKEDPIRERFNATATGMREVGHLSHRQLADTVRSDEIDILFDLTGFTASSRTRAFSYRAAPVQISWLGYPGSTGIPQMDYLFLDQFLRPANDNLITEQVLSTKGSTICFGGLDPVPITPVLPQDLRESITFGTLNNPYKFTREQLALWARVMHGSPNSNLYFVRREYDSAILRDNLTREFANHGINAERLYFYNNRVAGRHYLDCYNEIDISLDTAPVTGGTTTTDALWMGVPVVALEGDNVHQRVCSAILKHAGLPQWVAKDPDQFVTIAIELAADRQGRRLWRQQLRQQVIQSRLCDSQRFVADFAACMESLRGTAAKVERSAGDN